MRVVINCSVWFSIYATPCIPLPFPAGVPCHSPRVHHISRSLHLTFPVSSLLNFPYIFLLWVPQSFPSDALCKLWTYCAVHLCSCPFRVRFLVFSVNASLPFPMISLMVPWGILQYPPYFPSFCDTKRFLYATSAVLCTLLYTEFLLYSKCFSFRFRFCFSWPSPVRPSKHNSRVLSWFLSWFPPTLRLHFYSRMHLIVRHRVIPTRHYLYYLR